MPGRSLRLAAEAVGHPGPNARPAELLRAGVHHDLAGSMVERIGHHRFDDGDVIHDFGQVRQQFRQLGPALAVLGELELRPEQLGVGIDEGGAIALEQLRRAAGCHRTWRAAACCRTSSEMARSAGHEEVDDALGLGREMRLLGHERVRPWRCFPGCVTLLAKEIAERDGTQTDAALLQEPAASCKKAGETGLKIHRMALMVNEFGGVAFYQPG